MPPSGVDYASEFLNGYAPEYVERQIDVVVWLMLFRVLSAIICERHLGFFCAIESSCVLFSRR